MILLYIVHSWFRVQHLAPVALLVVDMGQSTWYITCSYQTQRLFLYVLLFT